MKSSSMQQFAYEIVDESPTFSGLLQSFMDICIDCPKCRAECVFLRRYGTPKAIAASVNAGGMDVTMAFECSLCGLCGAVCPKDLRPGELFLAMRREAVSKGSIDFKPYARILSYEKRGTSSRYSWYSLPSGCNTIFFPGCTLTGTRPDTTLALFDHLQTIDPAMGIVLDCCCKPSHDLGRHDYFTALFFEMKSFLMENGVNHIIVACPNCYKVFDSYGAPLEVKTVYELLAESGVPETCGIGDTATVSIHDPCVLRFEKSIQDAVRTLVNQKGCQIVEMNHSGKKTLCCGEGGSVGFVAPGLSGVWRANRGKERQGQRMITYCAGCAGSLKSVAPVTHILDLVFEPKAAIAGKSRVARPPFTYLNRFRVKHHIKTRHRAAVTRERTFIFETDDNKRVNGKRLAVLAMIAVLICAFHATGAVRFLDKETLRQWVSDWGAWAPVIYMLIYSLTPALFLPGLPVTIAGGILFGPIWGVVYAITGATVGACVAFLIARYVARDWVISRLHSPVWRRLDENVARHGWKIVAFTRLVPLFPFNLLNYAFGVTKIRFFDYAVTSFICMLPACIAFIVFSSSLPALLKGRISPGFFTGVVLITLVSMIPVIYRRHKGLGKK